MADTPIIRIDGTDYNVKDAQARADVAELKSALSELSNTQKQFLFNQTVSGSVMKQINVSIPAGTYLMKVDSVTSTDTQYTTSRVTFFGANSSSQSFDISRTNGKNGNITISFDATSIAFYGAHNYSDSSGVTFSYNNVKILADTGLSTRLTGIESNITSMDSEIDTIQDNLELVVNPVTFTESAGYYNESGVVQTASSSNQEKYTSKIPVNIAQSIAWKFDTRGTTAKSLWIAYMKYDADQNVVGTRVQVYNASATSASGTVEIPNGVAYVSFTYRTFGISNPFSCVQYIDESTIIKKDDRLTAVSSYAFPFARDKFFGHLLLNYVDEGNNFQRIVPCQSIFDVAMTARLGFKYIEANVQATATTGKYVVTHGVSGKLGSDFETVNGENVSNVVIAETSFNDLRTLYRYKSIYPKYKVPISSLEEFLYACKKNNIFPVLQYVDSTELAIARSIVGDNLILYGGSRYVFDGYIMSYQNLTTEAAIVQRCAEVGPPFMYCMGNVSSFTDEQLSSIISKVHKMGCFIGNVGAYDGPWKTNRCLNLGFDFSASGGMPNDFDYGNIVNICNSPTFDNVVTDGTVSNGSLTLAVGEKVTITSDDASFLKKYILSINFVGDLSITYPHKTGTTTDSTGTYSSDGTNNTIISGSLLNRTLTITAEAVNNSVTIKELSFKMSKC